MKFLYLSIDLGSFLVPFLFSFHPRIQFNRHFSSVFLSLILVAVPFIAWDIYFTHRGVWGFNPSYLTGIYFFNLPIEEVLFFIMIPFSCLFTQFCIRKLWLKDFQFVGANKILYLFSIILFSIAIINFDKYYTSWALLFDAIVLVVFAFFSPRSSTLFLISYLILQFPFLIVNGLLTGTGIESEVVWYNNNENLGLRVMTIPVEDFFYGMSFMLLNLFLFHRFTAKFSASATEN
jgi:lycopene cyclase domain-containing protein